MFLSLFLSKKQLKKYPPVRIIKKKKKKGQRALGTEPSFSIQEAKMQKHLGQDLDSGGGGQCYDPGTGMAGNRLHGVDVGEAPAGQWLADTVCTGNREPQCDHRLNPRLPDPMPQPVPCHLESLVAKGCGCCCQLYTQRGLPTPFAFTGFFSHRRIVPWVSLGLQCQWNEV